MDKPLAVKNKYCRAHINSLIYLGAAVVAVPVSKALGLGSIIGYFGGQKVFVIFARYRKLLKTIPDQLATR
jgi:hypothetical protein